MACCTRLLPAILACSLFGVRWCRLACTRWLGCKTQAKRRLPARLQTARCDSTTEDSQTDFLAWSGRPTPLSLCQLIVLLCVAGAWPGEWAARARWGRSPPDSSPLRMSHSCGWDGALTLLSTQFPAPVSRYSVVRLPSNAASPGEAKANCLRWSPNDAHTALACCSAGKAHIMDIRCRRLWSWEALERGVEGLALAWLPGCTTGFVLGGSLGTLVHCDLRHIDRPVSLHRAHSRGIHAIACAPSTSGTLLATASFDTSVKTWGLQDIAPTPGAPSAVPAGLADVASPVLATYRHHTEFATGVAWLPAQQGLVTCGWDKQLYVLPAGLGV